MSAPAKDLPPRTLRILCVGGSTRGDSSAEKALRVAASRVADLGAEAELISGPDLVLPIYAPEYVERAERALNLVAAVRRCDGLIIASPGYHGLVSGLVKNVLDYVEDTRADDRPYLHEVPVGCIAVAYGWQAAVTTMQSLRHVVHALRGWPTPFGASINASGSVFDETGCIDPAVQSQLSTVADQVVDFAQWRRRDSAAESLVTG
jgi:FMN reductase